MWQRGTKGAKRSRGGRKKAPTSGGHVPKMDGSIICPQTSAKK